MSSSAHSAFVANRIDWISNLLASKFCSVFFLLFNIALYCICVELRKILRKECKRRAEKKRQNVKSTCDSCEYKIDMNSQHKYKIWRLKIERKHRERKQKQIHSDPYNKRRELPTRKWIISTALSVEFCTDFTSLLKFVWPHTQNSIAHTHRNESTTKMKKIGHCSVLIWSNNSSDDSRYVHDNQ